MALHRSTAKATSTLVRLKSKMAQLELKANQLAARKNDVEAKADQLGKSLKRTIDTREKILLGALVKMVGLDRWQLNDNDTTPNRGQNDNVMASCAASYDLNLLVGGLLKLSEELNANDMTSIEGLRKSGREFRSQAKIDRVLKLRSS